MRMAARMKDVKSRWHMFANGAVSLTNPSIALKFLGGHRTVDAQTRAKGKARARKEAGPTKGLAICEKRKRLLGRMGQQQSNRLWTGWHF